MATNPAGDVRVPDGLEYWEEDVLDDVDSYGRCVMCGSWTEFMFCSEVCAEAYEDWEQGNEPPEPGSSDHESAH